MYFWVVEKVITLYFYIGLEDYKCIAKITLYFNFYINACFCCVSSNCMCLFCYLILLTWPKICVIFSLNCPDFKKTFFAKLKTLTNPSSLIRNLIHILTPKSAMKKQTQTRRMFIERNRQTESTHKQKKYTETNITNHIRKNIGLTQNKTRSQTWTFAPKDFANY